MMRRLAGRPWLIVSVLALAGCAGAAEKPPVCDGEHRRPVNIHGSVIGEAPGAADGADQGPAAGPLDLSAAAATGRWSRNC